jgi:hypothetical protein
VDAAFYEDYLLYSLMECRTKPDLLLIVLKLPVFEVMLHIVDTIFAVDVEEENRNHSQ